MIFYLDTSTSFLYSALYKDGNVIASIKEQLNRDLSRDSLYLINEMFDKNNVKIDDIEKIIVVNGPGSFTGIRIGLSIAKVFAWAKKIPIIPISSLEAMAFSDTTDANYIVPMIDARREFVYSSIYDKLNKSFILNEQHISLKTLLITLDNLEGKIVFVSNEKFDINYEIKEYEPDYKKIIDIVKDREPQNVHAIDANYLKRTEAEENLDDKRSSS